MSKVDPNHTMYDANGKAWNALCHPDGTIAVDKQDEYHLLGVEDSSCRFVKRGMLVAHYTNEPPSADWSLVSSVVLLASDTDHDSVRRYVRYGVRNGTAFIEYAE